MITDINATSRARSGRTSPEVTLDKYEKSKAFYCISEVRLFYKSKYILDYAGEKKSPKDIFNAVLSKEIILFSVVL